MAKNEWGDTPVEVEDPRSWGDRPAEQIDLPAGVKPSTAGAGRGAMSLADYRRAEAQRTPQESGAGFHVPGVIDPMGLGGGRPELGGVAVETRERPVSVLQTQGMAPPDPSRRLSMGAGPISQSTAARAERMVDGDDPGQDNRSTVIRAARGLSDQVARGEASTMGDLVRRAKSPAAQRLATQRQAEEVRNVGEWAVDSTSALLSGAVSLVELPTNIVAPGSSLAGKLGEWQQGLRELESPQMSARREQLADRVRNEDGFIDQYLATVAELVTNPSVAVHETLRQAAMFGGVLAAARGGQMLAQGAVAVGSRMSPTLALGEAISGGSIAAGAGQAGATLGGVAASTVMAAGDAAGNAFKHLMAQPQRAWDANEEYQQLIAEGVDPLKAKEDIATSKARLAAVIAAPLGLLGFMGAEASFVGSMAERAGRVASRQPARVLATELITEPAEEALTQMAGNAAVRTVDAGQSLTEGAGEAAGMATVTSGPFAVAGAVNELRKPIDRSEQIKALRAAGDTTAAEMLQRRFDRESAAYNAGTEAQRLQGFGAEVADRYRSIRAAGAKSGEAVVRTAIETAAARASDEAGLSPKARAALMEGLQTIPPEKAPQAIQRFIENMAAAGAAQPFDGLDNLAQQTEADMEGMLDAVLDDSVRPTMDAIEQLEDQTQAPAPDAQQADLSVPVDDTDFDAGNDVLVTPETDAVHAAATSPLNDLPEPTQAQKDAGNYKVGRIRLAGMDVSVENPQGSVRRGTSPDGTAWETPMRDHYGYIRGTTAADGDKLDVFIKPGTPPDFDGTVFVVDQVDPGTGKFDEAKVVMGAADQAEAEAIYLRNYSDGWQGLGAITALPMAEFKAWATSDRTRMPLADLPNQGPAAVSAPVAAQLYGQDGTPIAEGGRPFKTRRQADQARRLQSGMRVVSAEGGYALTEKTEAQIRSQERAAQRLRNADTGAGPISAHGHIAARGGMAKSTMGDLGFDRNVRVGNRWLFAATGGMSLDQAAQSLKQAGYLNDETEASAAAVISRSVRNPVYTPEGIEAIAEEQARQQFEEHLREQQEADDPFGPIDDFTDDELAAAGYAAASDDIKAQVAALLAQAEAMGLDAEGLLEDAARATTDQPEQAYYDQAQRSLEEAIGESARSRGDDELGQDGQEQPGKARPAGGEDRGQADGGQGEAGRVTGDQLLESPSREQVLQQQDRRDSAAARDDRDQIRRESDVGASQFTLTGEDGRQDTTASLFAMEPGDGYSRPYETDLFGEALPESTRAAAKAAGAARVRRDVQPTAAVPGDTPATPGEYFVRTAVGTEVTRKLGASRINSFADLAQATQYLYRSAVERLDAIVTDANGKPLAVVGGFKGAVNQTSVYPGTLVGEAVRVPGAARIWFSHNHPSGTAQLSRADETLNQSLTNVFRGSGIEPMGLIAVAGKKYADSESGVGSVRPAEGSTEVPVIERDLIAANAVSDIIDSPITAKSIARAFYGRANAPGIMLLDSQNRVSAWIPIPQDMRGHLRYGAGLNAIYRAVSESNAVSAIIAHGGELDETPFDRKDVTSAQNIMAALKQVDVRPLDTIDVKTGRSQAELGYLIDAGPVYRRDDDMNGQGLVITADLFRRMTTPVRYGMTVAELRSVVDPVVRSWANPPEIVVVDTAADLPMAAPSDAAGAYFQGTVYLVASRMRTPQKALQFLGHEAIAHYGLREMLGPDGWKSMMANIQLALKAGNVELGKLQAEVRQAYTDSDGKFRLSAETEADEIAARAVEMAVGPDGKFRPGFGFFKAVYAKIAEFLRGLGIKVAFTNTELQGMLVNAQRFLQVGQRTAGAGPAARPVWARGDVIRMPQVVIGSNLGAATSHPKYEAAKGGDVEAAVEVAKSLVTPQLIRQVRAEIGGAKPMVVPVVSVESSGRNKIPRAAAEVLAAELGLETADGITQSNRPRRTSLGGLDRIFARVEFDGPVTPGQDYLLLDDTLTQGGTFAALASHIEAGGGRVVGAVALTGKQYSAKIEPSTETIKALRDKHGDLEPAFKAATGYGFDALTESEARYLANFRPADAVRARILEAGRQASEGADPRSAGSNLDGPVFARAPTLRAPAQPAATTQETGDQDLPGASPAGEPASPEPDFWAVPQDTRGDRIVYELQDGRVDLKRVQQAITATRGKVDERFDARLAETLYPGRVARRSEKFLEDEAQPLLQVMARNNVTMDELSDFLHARHARERNEQIAKINPDMPDGGAGKNSKGELMTTAAAEAYLAGVSPLRRLVLDNLAARVDAITTGTRKLLVDEGLEKADTVKAWEGAYKAYVPLFRDEAEGGNPHHAGTGISVRGSASRRAMGSTKQATNILAHVLMQREAAITRAEKNRVGVALYGLALQAPNTDFWTTIRPSMSDAEIGAELRRMGVPEAAADGMTRAPTIRTVDPVLGRVIERPNPMYKSMPGAIVVKVNGGDRVLMFDTADVRGARMAESLKNLDGLTRLDIAGSVVGKATRWLAAVNTQYNPAFGLVNFVRDSIGGSVNITSTALRGKASKVLAMTPAAVAGIARELAGRPSGEWGKLFRQFQADGGQTGYREMFKDADARTKAIEAELKSLEKAGKLRGDRVVGAILGALDVFNTTLENAVRLAAYREALGAGMSRAESARLARELTVDFNRKGRTGREFGPLYAFFNASVQGSARTLQTLAGPAGAKIISAGLMLGVAQAVLLLLAGYDDDDIPEFVKSRALIVPLGESEKGEKRYFALPLPLGLHVLPNTGRVLAELTLSGGQDLGAKAFDAVGEIAGSFNPLGGGNVFEADGALRTIAPTLLDPLIELAANKNFAGAPIEREAAENDPRPGFQRARESTMRSATGQTYLEISRILNQVSGGDDYEAGTVSPTPERVRYLLQVLGGGLLREAEKIVNTAVDVSNGEEVKSRGVPVFGRFFGEVDDELVQRSRYFDNVREIERAERRLKAAAKAGDADAAEEIVKEVPTAVLGATKRATQSALRELNEAATLSLGDRDTIEAVDNARIERMRSLNDTADAVRREAFGPTPGDRLRDAVRQSSASPP